MRSHRPTCTAGGGTVVLCVCFEFYSSFKILNFKLVFLAITGSSNMYYWNLSAAKWALNFQNKVAVEVQVTTE